LCRLTARRPDDRLHDRAIPDSRRARLGLHERRVSGRGPPAGASGRAQVPPAEPRAEPRGARALPPPPRSADHLGAEPPEHLHRSRFRRARRPAVHRHGAARGHDPQGHARGGPAPGGPGGADRNRRGERARRGARTAAASSTAT
jgi:hypothetical protein